MKNKTVALMLALNILFNPALTLAAPTIPGFYGAVTLPTLPANTLPQPIGTTWTGVTSITTDSTKNQMTINQNQQYATINWSKFNIGANAVVYFNQKNATGVAQPTWAALNRIYDLNPSLIYGSLKADGKVYLINQNGILFGPNSQVNVHSLIASTMNLRDGDFLNGIFNFTAENYQDPNYVSPKSDGTAADNAIIAKNLALTPPNSQAIVTNYGAIQTDQGGKVYFIGPDVENYGAITTPSGASRLISALPLSQRPSDSDLFDLQTDAADSVTYNQYVTPGFAANRSGGLISADAGSVALYGATVNQEGIIRAVTTIKQNGQIGLYATDQIYLAPGSQTVTPVSDSKDALLETSNFQGGQITLAGITTDNSNNPYTPLSTVEQWGSIVAPSGQVNIQATGRVYLGEGSAIDVSGVWVDEPAGANIVTAQLNSVELNNDYGQKNGVLQGQTVSVNPVDGTTIGNIDGSYTSRELTAQERSTTGGSITIGNGSNGDALAQLIVMDGANLNFTGGGLRYSLGTMDTTMLASGSNVVPISAASEYTSYDAIIGQQQIVHARYGITDSYQGIYMGGGSSVRQLASNYVQGSDAGTLTLQARLQVLDGNIDGSVVRGPYQTTITTDPTARQLTVAEGIEEPLGGTMVIGTEEYNAQNPATNDFILGNTVITQNAPHLSAGFGPTDVLPVDRQQTTFLSADMLNAAGLSKLSISTNTTLTVDATTHLALLPGATLSVLAREFDLLGSIRIPDGSVNVTLRGNLTEPQSNPGYIAVNEGITLEDGSIIDVSGEQVDNSHAGTGGASPAVPHTGGGTIALEDLTDLGEGVIVNQGASLDVNGGYAINPNGKLSGGNAGGLTLVGNTLLINGDLRGLAMAGSAGGNLTLKAGTVSLSSTAATPPSGGTSPADDPGGLYISLGQLANSGFSQLNIGSRGDLTVAAGADLAPSLARYSPPVPGSSGAVGNTVDGVSAAQNIVVDPLIAGPTSISLSAGIQFDPARANPIREGGSKSADSVVTVTAGSAVRTTPGGSITLSGPAVAVNGTLESPGGSVTVTATQLHDLTIGANAEILAGGYNRVDSTNVGGLPAGWSPQPGGKVTLTATYGSLDIESGSVIDVSGSQPVTVMVKGADGLPTPITAASAPGSISLSYAQGVMLDGEILGNAKLAGLQGGSFAIRNVNGDMTLSSTDAARYQSWGFDDLTFGASGNLIFADDTTISARRITLDASQFTGVGVSNVLLNAPWVRLQNTNSTTVNSVDSTPAGGGAHLDITADWIDLNGALNASGFQELSLSARNDIRLSDKVYQLNPSDQTSPNIATIGLLNTAGDLVMDAARIYPTTLSQFSIVSAGEITILPHAGGTSPVVSAGGVLSMDAVNGIDVQGTLLAPMGQITLNSSNGRVLLEPGSLVSATGDSPVPYGQMNADGVWTIPNRDFSGQNLDVTTAPVQSVQITGKEVIVQNGARVEASGGGSVFSDVFQAGIEGSLDPRSITGRYVIMPDNSIVLPGPAVYLAGGGGLAPGVYSLLPVDYAFLPGARIVTDLGVTVAKGVQQKSADGLPVVAGYFMDQGSSTQSPFFEGYTVRLARDVLKEGNFTTKELVAGNGGTISLRGTTTVLNGSVSATGLTGFNGGSLEVGGQDITVGQVAAVLPDQFGFTTPLPADLTGTLLSTTSFVGKGFQEVQLGVSGATDSVTISAGSTVNVPDITITANRNITLEDGAQLIGVGADGKGSVSLTSGDSNNIGAVTIADNAIIHAGNSFSLNVTTPSGLAPSVVDLRGTVSVDSGTASLTGDRITLVNDSDTDRSGGGIFLSQSQWNAFKTVTDLRLTSRSDLAFSGDLNLSAGGDVTIDAARVSGTGNVSLTATGLNLMNSSGTSLSPQSTAQTGALAMQADRITVGSGDILFDGFGVVQLLAKQDLTLQGTGSIRTGWSNYNAAQSLELQGSQIVSALAKNSDGSFSPADFTVDASYGALSVTGSGTAAVSATGPGGYLSLKANQVDISGTITAPGGTLVVTTSDYNPPSAGISLTGSACLNVAGLTLTPAANADSSSIPGGKVELITGQGTLQMAQGTIIDVSGSGGSDAGAIVISAPNSAVDLQGNLLGNSNGGQGGALSLDAGSIITPLSALFTTLTSGGFNSAVDLRQRSGDLQVGAGQGMAAHEISLTADSGNITVAGTLDASAAGSGGIVELYAGKDLVVSGSISAAGTGSGATGGDVTLSSEGGFVNLTQGSSIVVSGSQQGGMVTLRAPWINNDTTVAMSIGNGSIVGAQQVVVEGVKVYSYGGPGTLMGTDFTDPNPGSPNIGSSSTSDATIYMNDLLNNVGAIMNSNGANVLNSLITQSGLTADVLNLRPEIEVRTAGDLTVASDITSLPRFSSVDAQGNPTTEPGYLTLRAGGNLTVGANIIDAVPNSWGITLTAGADLESADPTAVIRGTGNLAINAGTMVYTNNAPISFASGGNTSINAGTSNVSANNFVQSIGTTGGAIQGNVMGDLTLNGGVIQTVTGPINLEVNGDLTLDSSSAIRTIGVPTGIASYYWAYNNGGNLSLDVTGSVQGAVNPSAWDTTVTISVKKVNTTFWSPRIQAASGPATTTGIVTLGGGNLSIRSGEGFYGQAGTFGPGNFTLISGGNVAGRFLFKQGSANIVANGNFGDAAYPTSTVLEDFSSQIDVIAGGRIDLGSVVNPSAMLLYPSIWDLTYSQDSSVRLSALSGGITLAGSSAYASTASAGEGIAQILPPSVEFYAAGDIDLLNNLILPPSATGTLRLAAGGDISGLYTDSLGNVQHASIEMSDMDPTTVYGYKKIQTLANPASDFINGFATHAVQPVHTGDSVPVLVSAGGDISDLQFWLPKQADILAGNDIMDINANFQNLTSADLTIVKAGRDIVFSAGNAAYQGAEGIVCGGPGQLLVQAGRDIDLGTSNGITTNGNYDNPALDTTGSTVIVAAGTGYSMSEADEQIFFDGLRQAGINYATLKAKGNSAAAIAAINDARSQLIDPRFTSSANDATGSINMVNSQISTLAGSADIYIMARSDINVGKSTFITDTQRQASGIYTASGGAINIFSGGDLNVNESRVMTYLGGTITAWSNLGSINAGRGSKTTINSQPPHYIDLGGTPPVYQLVFTPPSAGSGIRALTYDPAVLPGDVYLFAPQGVIDAGEAGIAGGKVVLGATEVLNSQNISYSAGSVGVPTAESSVSLGSLAGAGSVADTGKMLAESSALGGAKDSLAQSNVVDQFLSKFLDVKVINYDTDEGFVGDDKQDEEKRKKK